MSKIHLLPVSARAPKALISMASSYREHLAQRTDLGLNDLCYSAALRRTHHEHRLVVLGASRADLVKGLESFIDGQMTDSVVAGRKLRSRGPSVAFLYPATMQDWAIEAGSLADGFPPFARALDRCDRLLRDELEWSLYHQVRRAGAPGSLDLATVETCQFALQVALTALWRSWGVRPRIAFGAGVGELAASWAAGVLALPDAIELLLSRHDKDRSAAAREPLGDGAEDGQSEKGRTPVARLFTASAGGEWSQSNSEMPTQLAHDGDLSGAWAAFASSTPSLIVDVTSDPEADGRPPMPETSEASGSFVQGLEEGVEPGSSMLRAFCHLYAAGVPVEWRGVVEPGASAVPLPPYAWQRRRFWWDDVPRLPRAGGRRGEDDSGGDRAAGERSEVRR